MTSDAEISGLPDNGELPPPKEARGPRFAAMVGTTATTHVAGLFLSIAASVIVARMLGPEGKGTITFIIAMASFLHTFGHLGIGSAITYRVSRGLTPAPVAAGYAVMLSLGLGLACFGGALVVILPRYTNWTDAAVVVIGLTLTPLLFLENYLGRTLSGLLKIHQKNLVAVVKHVLKIVFLGLLVWWLGKGVGGAMGAYVLALAGAVAMLFFFTWRHAGFAFRFDRAFLKGAVGYGILAYLLLFSNQMVYKVDIFFVKGFLGDTQLGFYSVAATLAGLLMMLPMAIGNVLFPVSASDASGGQRRLLRLCRLHIGFSCFGGPLLGILVPPLVYLAYGPSFFPAIWPFYALLPGVLLDPIGRYLTIYQAAQGHQRIPLAFSIAALALDVALVVLLVPRSAWYGGIVGAGIASSLAYGMKAMALALHFSRAKGIPMRSMLVPNVSDWQVLGSLAARVWSRIRRLKTKYL